MSTQPCVRGDGEDSVAMRLPPEVGSRHVRRLRAALGGAAIAGNTGASAWTRTRHPPFGEAGALLYRKRGKRFTGSGGKRARAQNRTGVHKGGRFTAGGASIAHLWHGVITGYRSRAEGSTTPYAAFTP
jgi:hypothetical protein